MKHIITLSILLFSLMITSCKVTFEKTIEVPSSEVYSGRYEIKSLNGSELKRTLSFTIETSENKISGKTDCNNYFATYSVSKNEIEIGPLGATEMYCEENVMKAERELLKAYSDSKTFSFDGKMLTLFSEGGTLLIRAYKISK